MRRLCIILSFFTILPAAGQDDPARLAAKLTSNLTTEKEKITAIFRWITDNIAYRTRNNRPPVLGSSSRKYVQWLNAEEDTGALKPLNERVSITVMRNGVAICEGYARLFTTLCDFAGIRSVIIPGYASNSRNKPVPRFGVNHYWNAVMIDSGWHLLDATWASGYITSGGGDFVREYDADYFLTPPEQFIRDHYPDDIRWTLLPDNRVPAEFGYSPFLQKSFYKYSITEFWPRKGVIEATVGDTIRLQLSTSDPERDKVISPDTLVDSTIFSQSSSWVFLRPATGQSGALAGKKHEYILPVTERGISWVYLMYNEDMVLRYKLNIRNR
jgi:Transglutaminase-like superfamily